MNAVGRQMMQRSGSTGYHQRQYSDNFLEGATFNKNNKWLQSQDFGLYGNNGGCQDSKLSKNVQRGGMIGGGNEGSSTPLSLSRSSNMRLYGSSGLVSPNELSLGLFDLNSVDTELLSEFVTAFIYQRNGELVSCKYRGIDKTFWQENNTEKILYGLDDINGARDIIIVEGEIEKLSMEEAGFRNCVSVPDGTPPSVSKKDLPSEEEVSVNPKLSSLFFRKLSHG